MCDNNKAAAGVTHDELYDAMVSNPAAEISQMIQLTSEGRARLLALGADPDEVISNCQEGVYEDIKESLRPAFYKRARELGINAGG